MRINNYTTKDYTEFKETYQLVLPLNLERLIPEDDSVRLLSHLLEGLNYAKLYQAYSSKGRKSALDPSITKSCMFQRPLLPSGRVPMQTS